MKRGARQGAMVAVVACALALVGCATENDERDSMGSRLYQPPPGTKRPPPVDAGDIAIVGQDVAQAILQLEPISSASTPPLVRFNGVTSIVNPPIDTTPYTQLLRDRLLLLTREKLRFVEHTLPPFKGHATDVGDAQYQVLAEIRGQAKAPTFKVQVEFLEIGSGNILFNQTYRIAKEEDSSGDTAGYTAPMAAPQQPSGPPQEPAASGEPAVGSINKETGDPNNPPPNYYDARPTTNTSGGSTPLY